MDKASSFLLRASVAFAFLYPPINALFDPAAWVGYFPQALRTAAQSAGVPELVLLHGFGLIEAGLALWMLWGRKGYIPAAAAAAVLVAIVLSDLSDFPILFRDVAIALAAAALAVDLWYKEKHV
jgi:hypothetical protein